MNALGVEFKSSFTTASAAPATTATLGSTTCDLPSSAYLLASTLYRISELIMLGRTMAGLYCPTILTEPMVCIRVNFMLWDLTRPGASPDGGASTSSAKADSYGFC